MFRMAIDIVCLTLYTEVSPKEGDVLEQFPTGHAVTRTANRGGMALLPIPFMGWVSAPRMTDDLRNYSALYRR